MNGCVAEFRYSIALLEILLEIVAYPWMTKPCFVAGILRSGLRAIVIT